MPPRARNKAAEAVTHTLPPCIHGTPALRASRAPPVSPPVQMDAAAIKRLITEKVATFMANWATNQGSVSDSPSNGDHGKRPRVCTYKDFASCRPRLFYGEEGGAALDHWFEQIESAFEACECPEGSKVMYATCTLMSSAWAWWSATVRTLSLPVATTMSWADLKEAMLEEFWPRSRIQTPAREFWKLTMKGSDLTTYTNRFDELSVLCPEMVQPELERIGRYIWGLTPEIQGGVLAARPTTILSAKYIARQLVNYGVGPEANYFQGEDNKRKRERNEEERSLRNYQLKQPTVAVLAALPSTIPAPSKAYLGELPECHRCDYHHKGACRRCAKCGALGHNAPSCVWTTEALRKIDSRVATRACYKCGDTGHLKKDCTKPKGGD